MATPEKYGQTLTGLFIIDPGEITLVVGDAKFMVRGRLAKGLRSLLKFREPK